MKILVVSYSLTGNNDGLAAHIAAAFSGTHCRIVEAKPRSMGTTALDMLFGRVPAVNIPAELNAGFDAVIFAAPVWMGKAASPLRACFAHLRGKPGRYAFVSLSGGADGPDSNAALAADLEKRLKAVPSAVVDLHIADLLPADPKPVRAKTSAYRATEDDYRNLTARAVAALRDAGISV